jgi:hypothetical protein
METNGQRENMALKAKLNKEGEAADGEGMVRSPGRKAGGSFIEFQEPFPPCLCPLMAITVMLFTVAICSMRGKKET